MIERQRAIKKCGAIDSEMARQQQGSSSGSYKSLVEACKRKELASIRTILDERPDLANQKDKQNRTLLHYVVLLMIGDENGDSKPTFDCQSMTREKIEQCIECFDFLTDRCDIKLWWHQDSDGLSVLHMAVISSNVPMVEYIIYEHPYALKYPLVRTLDREHHSPLHWAVITNNLDSVKLLVNYAGTELVHEPDLNGATPLHYATQTNDYPRYRKQLSSMLKNVGATSNSRQISSHKSKIEEAIGLNSGATQIIDKPKQDADQSKFDSIQLPSAVAYQQQADLRILEFLVSLPQINLECIDRDHRTPLLWAASSGNRDAIELLLAHGANIASCDANCLSALHCAASHGFTDCLDAIFHNSGRSTTRRQEVNANQTDNLNCTPLFYSVLSGNIDCIETLLERGADSDWQDSKGRTAAHFAALKGQLGALKLLYERGANLWLANKQGDLPLHYAIKSGRLQVVRWLLEHSPYERAVNAINNFGRAPIHLAIMKDNVQLVDYLIRCGANLNQLVKTKRTKPCRNKPSDVVEPLEHIESDREASKSQKKTIGVMAYHYETALDMAKNMGHNECLKLLEQNQAHSSNQVISSRQQGESSSTGKSIFDMQSIDGPTPIGFETSCSSTSPNTTSRNTTNTNSSLASKAKPSTEVENQVPKLHRPVPDSLPCTDSTGSSALSQNSLTSVRGFDGERQEPFPSSSAFRKVNTDYNGEKVRDGCDKWAKNHNATAAHSAGSQRPYRGGISYNNEHICASIKCKLYDKLSSSQRCTCNGSNAHPNINSEGDILPPTRTKQIQGPHPAPVGFFWRGGQEIITNVKVYTSPCPHCMHQLISEKRCSNCSEAKQVEINDGALSSPTNYKTAENAQIHRDIVFSATDETATSDDGSEVDGNSPLSRSHLPNLLTSSSPQLMINQHQNRIRHLPPSQGYEQHLPVIMSDREQSTSVTSNEQQDEEEEEEAQGDNYRSKDSIRTQELQSEENQANTIERDGDIHGSHQQGQQYQQKASPIKRPLVSPAFEEPRFYRLPLSSPSKVPKANDRYMNRSIKSPVAEYIHGQSSSPRTQKQQQVELSSDNKRSRKPRATSSQRTPDFSRVKPKVDTNRLPAGDSRSKSMSVLSRDTSTPLGLKSPAKIMGAERSRSVSRQTIIKTRRLSVDSVELASRVEKAIRKYRQETKLFEELQNLKRSQIRSGRANEALLVKRLVEHLRQDTQDLIGLDSYQGPYTYKSYERFLYDQLRKLSKSNCAKLSRHQPPYRQDSYHLLDDNMDRNYLDEDLKADMELRRIMGNSNEDIEKNEQQSGDGESDTTESYLLEPTGALEDIRVKKEKIQLEEEFELSSGSGQDSNSKESMQIVHPNSEKMEVLDATVELLESDEVKSRPVAMRECSSSTDSEGETSSKEKEDVDNKEELSEEVNDDIEDEAKSLSSAIITDALGNVSRAGSLIDLNKLDSAKKEDPNKPKDSDSTNQCSKVTAKSENDKGGLESICNPEMSYASSSEDSRGEQLQKPTTGRRRSIVNIGNKMELIYHDVGIEIDPAPDELEEEEQQGIDQDLNHQNVTNVAETATGLKDSVNLATDINKEEQFKSETGKSKESDVDTNSGNEPEGVVRSSEGRESSEYTAPTTVVGSNEATISESTTSDHPISLVENTRRRASSPSTCRSEFTLKKGPQLQRDPKRWSGGSSLSDASNGEINRSKIFNGYDLDALHRERSRSRGKVERVCSREEPSEAKAEAGVEESSGGADSEREVQDHQLDSVKEISDSPNCKLAKKHSRKSVFKHRLARSRIPDVEYTPVINFDEIRQRWSRIKLEGRSKLAENSTGRPCIDFMRARTREKDDLLSAKSQPNLRGSSSQSVDDDIERDSTGQPNYILLYEINRSMKGLSDPRDIKESADSMGKSVRVLKQKSRKWCQRMAAQIVDVRTVKRTLSLPETVMYSNDLLKRFNILKL